MRKNKSFEALTNMILFFILKHSQFYFMTSFLCSHIQNKKTRKDGIYSLENNVFMFVVS